MQQADAPVLRDIVLVGGGHSHVGVLRRFAMRPEPGVRLTLICRDTHTPYSGMLPGYVAGHYGFDEVHIDLRRLAEFAGARFYGDEAVGIDHAGQRVLCRSRPPVPYDRLSINIGSTPRVAQVAGADTHAVPVKPIHRFNDRWQALLERIRRHPGTTRIAVVGGGAGGVELLLAMHYRLRRERLAQGGDPETLAFALFTRSARILPTHNARVRARFERVLARRGIALHTATEVTGVEAGGLRCGAQWHAADEIVWVTDAGGAAWLRDTRLALDDDGFIRVDATLRSVSDPRVFAAGDVASQDGHPREKAGVFAVRQGRPLADNLRAALTGRRLRPYRPQRRWLALISTGDRHAVASRGALCLAGDWVWRWKDWIDRRFMARFNELPPMEEGTGQANTASRVTLAEEERDQAISALAMRCGGCGAKVGASVLSRALSTLAPFPRDEVLIGLHAPDDAAVVRVPPGMAMVHTVDFFRAFIDDPYVFGKVAANHALGDIFAMGAEAQTATAIATVPQGLEAKVEDTVFQMMSGALEVLNAADCSLVGGHTGEGRELALGFAVNGLIDPDRALRKAGMRPGDALILTKPLGTGTLFAAHARLAARGRWIDAALAAMCQSNRLAARCLRDHGATACTDLTGFGLLGHLVEMTRPSGVDAELDLAALPLLEGAEETVAAGILSSLQPANVRLRRALRDQPQWVEHPRYPLLFDPQTAGGLLASVPADRAATCVTALHALGYTRAALIGRVCEAGEAPEPIVLRHAALTPSALDS
ncbi:selenide, water dikinase SelD [Billgrantia azerbaijanica]|nr:selenide, water dikinase SelD [Halomonas azerbaijanica]